MIVNFADKQAEALWHRRRPKRLPPSMHRLALRKLTMVDAATAVQDLRLPPGNRLEMLKGDRKGQHSIRINDQWRVCFRWRGGNAHDVQIVDYHG